MLKRILKYIFVAIIICYSLFAMIVIPTLRDNGTCSEVLVDISKNNFETISDEEILEILDEAGINPELKKMDDIVCSDIEQYFNNISLIKECQVYKGNKDYLNIRIDCREPIIRIHDKNNNTYYPFPLPSQVSREFCIASPTTTCRAPSSATTTPSRSSLW